MCFHCDIYKGIKETPRHTKSNSVLNEWELDHDATKDVIISIQKEERISQFETINTWELMEGLDDDEEEDENLSLNPRNDPLQRALSFKYVFSRGNYEDNKNLGLTSFSPFSAPSSPEFSAAVSLKDWLPSNNHSSKHIEELMGTLQSSILDVCQHTQVNPEQQGQLKHADDEPTQSIDNHITQDALFDKIEVMKDSSKVPVFDPELLETFERAMLQLSKEEWNAVRSIEESPSNFAHFVNSFKRSCSNSLYPLKIADMDNAALASTHRNHRNATYTDDSDTISKISNRRTANQTSIHDDRNRMMISWGNILTINRQNSWQPKKATTINSKVNDGKCFNVVFYSTTLQPVTKSFKDCNQVREILISIIGATFDERNISNHQQHLEELKYALNISDAVVPTIYVKGKYIVGIDSILQLYKKGVLGPMLKKALQAEPETSVPLI